LIFGTDVILLSIDRGVYILFFEGGGLVDSRIGFCHHCKRRLLIRQDDEKALVYVVFNKPNGNGGKPELFLKLTFKARIPQDQCPKCRSKQFQESKDSKMLGMLTKLAEKKEGKQEAMGAVG
jgi:hypothetical protein